jgi:1-acyl-sn-glycerol-3-phosphate acyltransferase
MVFIKAAINKIWFNLIRYTSKVLFILLYGMKVYGKENLSKDRGPLLLVCNHQSFFDPVFAQSVFNRELNFVARDSLFDNKFLGALITSLHTIPIKRGEGDITAMRKVIKNLKENKAVCLFPEGTRSPDGKIGEIKPGFSLISRKSGASILPVVIDGAFEAWPRDKKYPGLGKVAIKYGTVKTCDEIKEMGEEKFAEMLTEEMRQLQKDCRESLGREPFVY